MMVMIVKGHRQIMMTPSYTVTIPFYFGSYLSFSLHSDVFDSMTD